MVIENTPRLGLTPTNPMMDWEVEYILDICLCSTIQKSGNIPHWEGSSVLGSWEAARMASSSSCLVSPLLLVVPTSWVRCEFSSWAYALNVLLLHLSDTLSSCNSSSNQSRRRRQQSMSRCPLPIHVYLLPLVHPRPVHFSRTIY